MSFLRSALHVVSPLVLATATLAAGCTQPYKAIGCVDDTNCPTMEEIEHLTFDDAGAGYQVSNGVSTPTGVDIPKNGNGQQIAAQCCANLCVIQSSGCDSGFRYIAHHSGGGYDVSVCVDSSLMCVAPAPPPTE